MKKNKKAFSIIEVITASIILSIAVFGVFKMISENEKIINNSENYNTALSIFQPFSECLDNIKPNSTEKKYLDLNNCQSKNTQTGITINNIDYILTYSGITNNKFDLYITNDSLRLKQEYIINN